MKPETLEKIILETNMQIPPAITGDTRGAAVLGYIISSQLGPESSHRVFALVFGTTIKDAMQQMVDLIPDEGKSH